MSNLDTELSVMESIASADGSSATLTQRDIASRSGLSLGMTNALLKRLAERGWIKLTRISTRTIRYALSPEGVTEIARRSAAYFRRSSRNADVYRERLESFILGELRKGIGTLVLVGSSELDFLLEYICERHGIVFLKSADFARACALARRPGVLLVTTAKEPEQAASGVKPVSLEDIFSGVRGYTIDSAPDRSADRGGHV
jgi:DNA-binding MarR family transcriptional regulator